MSGQPSLAMYKYEVPSIIHARDGDGTQITKSEGKF